MRQGWRPDPYGIHEHRYFSQDLPTRLVRDGGRETFDDPPDHPLPGDTAAEPALVDTAAEPALVGAALAEPAADEPVATTDVSPWAPSWPESGREPDLPGPRHESADTGETASDAAVDVPLSPARAASPTHAATTTDDVLVFGGAGDDEPPEPNRKRRRRTWWLVAAAVAATTVGVVARVALAPDAASTPPTLAPVAAPLTGATTNGGGLGPQVGATEATLFQAFDPWWVADAASLIEDVGTAGSGNGVTLRAACSRVSLASAALTSHGAPAPPPVLVQVVGAADAAATQVASSCARWVAAGRPTPTEARSALASAITAVDEVTDLRWVEARRLGASSDWPNADVHVLAPLSVCWSGVIGTQRVSGCGRQRFAIPAVASVTVELARVTGRGTLSAAYESHGGVVDHTGVAAGGLTTTLRA